MHYKRPSLAVLDVGHGNSAVLSDSGGVVVIDSGAGSALLEFLETQEIKQIDVLLLSHADKDHIGGLVALLAAKTVDIARVCLNGDASKGTEVWDDLLFVLNQESLKGRIVLETSIARDDFGKYNQGSVQVQILGPSKYLVGKGVNGKERFKRKIRSNSLSVVVRLLLDGKPLALLPGDLDEIGLDDLLADGADASAPLLVFPHHGGGTGTPIESFVRKLCAAVSPSTIVFSVARGRAKHPLPIIFKELHKNLKNFRIVCTQLSEHCAKMIPRTEPKHLVDLYSEGRENRKCCAGTLVLDLNKPEALFPLPAAHKEFIDKNAPTALCKQ